MEKQDRIDQLVAENQELLALTKQAFVKREVEKESVSVDEEWEKFAAEHAEELEALEKDEPHAVGGDLQSPTREVRISNPFHLGILPYKVAASIAAIHIVRHFVGEDVKSPTQEVQIPNSSQPSPALSADTVKTDTTANAKPIVFDNVALDKMLPQIAAYYNKEVEFQNTDARQLRFYFVWKQEHHRRTEVGQDSSRISHEENHINACLLSCLCRSTGPEDDGEEQSSYARI